MTGGGNDQALQVCEVGLGVVAIDSGGRAEGIAVGGDGLAVLADAVGNDLTGIHRAARLVDRHDVDRLVNVLGGDAIHSSRPRAAILRHLHHAGGVGGGQLGHTVIGIAVPIDEGQAVIAGQAIGEIVVDRESALEGNGGIDAGEGTGLHHEVTGSGIIRRHHVVHHRLVVGVDQVLGGGGQEGIHQVIGVVAEVHLGLRAVVQHGHHQTLGIHGGAGAAQNGFGVGNGVVASHIRIDVGAVGELSVDLEVQRVAQILGRDAVGVDDIAAAGGGVAGDDLYRVGDGAVGELGIEGDQAHFRHVGQVGQGEIHIVLDLILKGQSGIAQGDGGGHDLLLLGGLIAQGQGTVTVLDQCEGDLHAAGNVHLIRSDGRGIGIVEGHGGGLKALPAIGHVPGGVIGGLDRHIAVGIEGGDQLAILEQVVTTVGIVFLAAIVGSVDIAEQVVILIDRAAQRADTIHEVVLAHAAAKRADTVHKAVAYKVTAVLAVAVGIMGGVGTGCRHIAQGQGAIAIVDQCEGYLTAHGDIQLVTGGSHNRRIVQLDGGDALALPAIGHVPGGIISGLDRDVAVLLEGGHQLAVHEFVFADILVVFLAGVVGTVDEAKEIILIHLLLHSADGAGAIGVAMGTDLAADGAGAVGVAMAAGQSANGAGAVGVAMAAGLAAQGAGAIGVGVVAGLAADAAGAAAPDMVAQSRGLQLIDRTGLHLTGGAGGHRCVAPRGEVRPAFICELLIISGIVLSIDARDEPPVGVGAGGMGGLIAHIGGIAGIVAGVGGIVVGVEGGIAAALGRCRINRAGIAPVIVKIADYRIGIDRGLGGGGLTGGDLIAQIVVLGVQAVGGGEAGGPAADVVHRAAAGLHPLAALEGIAAHGGLVGGLGLVVGVAVLGLAVEQAGGHSSRHIVDPAGGQLVRAQCIVVSADRAGELVLFVLTAGRRMGGHGIVVTGSGDGLRVYIAADRTGAALRAVGGAGGAGGGGPAAIGVAAGRGRRGDVAAGGARFYGSHSIRTAATADGRGGVGVAAAGLIHLRGNHHEILLDQRNGPSIGLQCGGTIGIIVDVVRRNGVGVVTSTNVAKGCIIVDGTVEQRIGIAVHRVAITGDGAAAGAEAFVDPDRRVRDLVVAGLDIAGDIEDLAGHMAIGGIVIGYGDIRGQLLDIFTFSAIYVAGLAAGCGDLIPVVAVGVLIQSGGSVGGTGIGHFQRLGAVLGADAAGQTVDHRIIHGDLDLAMSRILGAAGQIAKIRIGPGGSGEGSDPIQVSGGIQLCQGAVAVLSAVRAQQAQLAVHDVVARIGASGGEGPLGAVVGIEGAAGDSLHEFVVFIAAAGTVADQLAAHTVAAARQGIVHAAGMDIDAVAGIAVAGGAGIGSIPAGIAAGGMGSVVAVVVDGGHLVDAVQDRGGTAGLIARGDVVGVIRDGAALLTVERDVRVAAGIQLHNDTHGLQTDLTRAIHIGIGIIIVRAALEHEDNRLAGTQRTGQGAIIVDVVLHHGVDVDLTGAVGNKSRAGQRVKTADRSLRLYLNTRYEGRDQTEHQADDQ